MIWFLFRVNFLFRNCVYIYGMRAAYNFYSQAFGNICEWTGGVKVVGLLNIWMCQRSTKSYHFIYDYFMPQNNLNYLPRLEYHRDKLFEFQTKIGCMQEFPSTFFPKKKLLSMLTVCGDLRPKTIYITPKDISIRRRCMNNKCVRLCDWNFEWNVYSFASTLTVFKIHIYYNVNSTFMVEVYSKFMSL